MMTTPRTLALVGALTLTVLPACGSNAGDGGLELSPTAAEGRSITRTNGCASCHGSNGQGGVGPAFVGLFGSEVPLVDGSTVTADEAYLRESIEEPDAKKVAGFALNMPTNDLSDAEVDQIVAYIIELGDAGDATATPDLSPEAAEGLAISRSSGCASCHGSDGQGGLASPFVGLLGSEIELDDGSTVVADEAYIRESITDPDARNAADQRLPMPSNNLSDDEVDLVVAYIVELSRDEGS
jgi:cytochrome c oxidase subunit 2